MFEQNLSVVHTKKFVKHYSSLVSVRAQKEMEEALGKAEQHPAFMVGFLLAGNYKISFLKFYNLSDTPHKQQTAFICVKKTKNT